MSSESSDLTSSVRALLHCLPLLRTGNTQAKGVYLRVIPTVLRRATETQRHLAECQQILSYALIHPAISADELTTLSAWQSRLMDEAAAAAAAAAAGASPPQQTNPSCSLPSATNGGPTPTVLPSPDGLVEERWEEAGELLASRLSMGPPVDTHHRVTGLLSRILGGLISYL